MIKSKILNITNNNFMTTHKINKLSKNAFNKIKSTLIAEYNPKYRFSTIFSDKDHKNKLDYRDRKYIEAGVLCILTPSNNYDSMEIILTVRSKKLKNHSGQISFPGGKLDKTDNNLIECALRETYEEIGIEKKKIQTIGMMNKYITGTGFLVTPVIATLKEKIKYNINKNEVDEIISFPLSYFSKEKKNELAFFYNDKKEKFFYYDFKWQGYRVWGTTAFILYDINKILNKIFKNQ